MLTSFQNLSQEQKVDFFVKCQSLMLKHHPSSPFLIREDKLEAALDSFIGNIHKYQGFYYTNENICVLWNHIVITDPNDVQKAVKDNAYRAPNPDFNAVSIDFAVFKEIKDCAEFVRECRNERIKHVLFIRNGDPRIYPIDVLLRGVGV